MDCSSKASENALPISFNTDNSAALRWEVSNNLALSSASATSFVIDSKRVFSSSESGLSGSSSISIAPITSPRIAKGLVNELNKRGVTDIIGYDPKALETAEIELGDKIKYAGSVEEALEDSECALLITEWEEFNTLTPEDFKKHMKISNLVDGRRIFDYESFNEVLHFRAIGRIDLK